MAKLQSTRQLQINLKNERLSSFRYLIKSIKPFSTVSVQNFNLVHTNYQKYAKKERKYYDNLILNRVKNPQEPLMLSKLKLYPEGYSTVLDQLYDCETMKDVFQVLDNMSCLPDVRESTQAIATLSFLQKVSVYLEYKHLPQDMELFQYPISVLHNPLFHAMVDKIGKEYDKLEQFPLVVMLLHFSRIGLLPTQYPKQKIIDKIVSKRYELDLASIHYFSLALKNLKVKSYAPFNLIVDPFVINMKAMNNIDDLFLSAEIILNMSKLITDHHLEIFFSKVEEILHIQNNQDGVNINKNQTGLDIHKDQECLKIDTNQESSALHSRVALSTSIFRNNDNDQESLSVIQNEGQNQIILKVLEVMKKFAEKPFIKNSMYRDLLLKLDYESLNYSDICFLKLILFILQEPGKAIDKINRRANEIMDTLDNRAALINLKLSLASGYVELQQEEYNEYIRELVQPKDVSYNIAYHSLKNLRLSDSKLCDKFWNGYFDCVEKAHNVIDYSLGGKNLYLSYISYHYMNFNNNNNYTYRNLKFEKNVIDLIKREIIEADVIIPSKFCIFASFIIAYADPEDPFRETINLKLRRILEQVDVNSLLSISRGMLIAGKLNKNPSPKYTKISNDLYVIFDIIIQRLLKNQLSPRELILFFDTYVSRSKTYRIEPTILEQLETAIVDNKHQMVSMDIKRLTLVLYRHKFHSRPIINLMGNYILNNDNYVTLNVVHELLKLNLYNNILPVQSTRYLDLCVDLLQKDGHKLPPHNLLEACLALALNLRLNSNIIRSIFRVSFLNKIEEYISRNSYHYKFSNKLRFLLMELNRAVCIDYPEDNVPWFHEKYCKDIAPLFPTPEDRIFHEEVEDILKKIFNDKGNIKVMSSSPYHYLLDFEFMTDEEGKLVLILDWPNVSKRSTRDYKKYAVLLRYESHYCKNNRELRGRVVMQNRHLEILGYEVIQIPYFEWYSMQMSTDEDRFSYLKSLVH